MLLLGRQDIHETEESAPAKDMGKTKEPGKGGRAHQGSEMPKSPEQHEARDGHLQEELDALRNQLEEQHKQALSAEVHPTLVRELLS